MIQRFLTLFAAVALLAACETASDVSSDVSGTSNDSTNNGVSSSSNTGSDDGTSNSGTTAQKKAKQKAKASAEKKLTQIGVTTYFGFDSSVLSAKAQATLNRQAAFLKSEPALRIIIQGHCDERGTREYNLALGDRRASVARDYLVAKGVNSARIRTISYGKERPAIVGSNKSAWAKNRRTVTVIN